MANSFFVPFNFEPVETTRETNTYSLAAGKYARITPIEFGSALVADGEILYPSIAPGYSVQFDTSSTSDVTVFTCPQGVILEGNVFHKSNFISVNSTLSIYRQDGTLLAVNRLGAAITGTNITNSTSFITSDNTSNLRLYAGDYIAHKINNGAYVSSVKLSLSPVGYKQNPQFWVSGGSSGITITGDTFVVELFNQIS